MEKFTLTKIFFDVYTDMMRYSKNDSSKKIYNSMIIYDNEEFESTLETFLLDLIGYSFYRDYINYRDGRTETFEYFGEVRQYFESVLLNGDRKKMLDMELWIDDYVRQYKRELDNHPFVNLFINACKKILSNNEKEVYIKKDGKKYTIGLIQHRKEDNMPLIIIDNIDNFEEVISDYLDALYETDNFYKKPITDFGYGEDEGVEYILSWTILNATALDLECCENYFAKYTSFLRDETFNCYRKTPTNLGNILDDEVYLLLKKSTVAYETPYYLAFMLKNRQIELPNIRMGIETNQKGRTIAHILATQSSQSMNSKINEMEYNNLIKTYLPKSKYFREYNPSHLVSLVMTVGLLKGMDINIVRLPNYIPLRYRKLILEGRKNEDEIEYYQHRLTNKFTNNFFRLVEVSHGIDIASYPENGNTTEVKLTDNIYFENEFLNNLYQMAYNAAKSNNINDENKTKKLI